MTIYQLLLRILTAIFIFTYPAIKTSSPLFFPTWLLYVYSFILICLCVYNILYSYLGLEKSLASFIFFTLNCLILILYLQGLFILMKGDQSPIYLNNLSIFSQYRYLLFAIICVLGIIFYLVSLCIPQISMYFEYISYPYLKEEIRKILYVWNESFWGPICTFIIDQLFYSVFFRFCYFFIHFTLFVAFRTYVLYLFVNFVFFNADLYSIFYLLPLLFVIWILRFFEYYFFFFFDSSCIYIRSLLVIEFNNNEQDVFWGPLIKIKPIKNITLTSLAEKHGYTSTQNTLDILFQLWISYAQLHTIFTFYKKFFKIFNYTLFIIRLCCWFYIVNYFFVTDFTYFDFFYHIVRRYFHATRPAYSPQIHGVRSQFQKKMEQATDGSYKQGHPVIVDTDVKDPEDAGKGWYMGSPTHGSGSKENPSTTLDPQIDAKGESREQKFVPPVNGDTFVFISWLTNLPFSDSKQYLEKNKENLKKHQPIPENT